MHVHNTKTTALEQKILRIIQMCIFKISLHESPKPLHIMYVILVRHPVRSIRWLKCYACLCPIQ